MRHLLGFVLLGGIITIMIEYIDWNDLFGGESRKIEKKKEKKKSNINRSVVGSILLVIAIAIAASLTK